MVGRTDISRCDDAVGASLADLGKPADPTVRQTRCDRRRSIAWTMTAHHHCRATSETFDRFPNPEVPGVREVAHPGGAETRQQTPWLRRLGPRDLGDIEPTCHGPPAGDRARPNLTRSVQTFMSSTGWRHHRIGLRLRCARCDGCVTADSKKELRTAPSYDLDDIVSHCTMWAPLLIMPAEMSQAEYTATRPLPVRDDHDPTGRDQLSGMRTVALPPTE